MKTSKILFAVALITGAMGLASCGEKPINNQPSDRLMANRLAYQATTSLSSMYSMNTQSTMMGRRLAKSEEKPIAPETKQKIEDLLPTIDLLSANDNNFQTEVIASDRDTYKYKQVVTLKSLSGEEISYTLYYNLGSEDKNSNVEDLDDDENETPNIEESETPSVEESVQPEEEVKPAKNEAEEQDDDDDDDDDLYDRDDVAKYESITTFDGIAVIDEKELNFVAKTNEEVEDEEIEKKFALRIYSNETSYVNVVHEIEEEENEKEESYTYEIYEENELVKSFAFEKEVETEDNQKETEMTLVIDNEEFEFEMYTKNEETFIEVEYANSKDAEYKLLYKKEVTTDENNNKVVTFKEVK